MTSKGKSKETIFIELQKQFQSEGRKLVVIYNAQFDLSFLKAFFNSFGEKELFLEVDFIDVLTVFKDRAPYPRKLKNAIHFYSLEGKVENSHRALDDVISTFELLKVMSEERNDLTKYINLFGYNPRYGVNYEKFPQITYKKQPYDNIKPLYETTEEEKY